MFKFIIKNKDKIYYFLDILILIMLTFLVIRKGGFYKSDCLPINLIITTVSVIYIVIKSIFYLKNNIIKSKSEYNYIFLFILSICYLLPILFNNYSSYSDAIYEFIRYFNIFLIYIIVKNSENKKIYTSFIVFIGVIECILGVDQIACRYLNDTLKLFGSGYLSNTLDRMSSTIQYANTLAIIICICIIILIKKIDTILEDKKSIKVASLLTLLNFFFTSLVLTKTRFAFLTLLIGIIMLLKFDIKNKSQILGISIFNIILSFILSNFISSYMGFEPQKIYYIFVIFYIIYLFVAYIVLKIDIIKKIKIKIKIKIKKLSLIIITCVGVITYIILAFNLAKSVTLNEIKNKYTAYFYNNIKSSNVVTVDLDEIEEDSVFKIEVYKVTIDNKHELFEYATQENYDSGKVTIDLSKYNIQDCKSIKINFILDYGSVNINKVWINDKDYAISYYLLPYEFVSRLNDSINNSDSMTSRYTYLKDALKIITSSPKSFIIGNGGEAFRNMYNQFKTQNYTSTEVHNSYVQIFCEAGILGFIVIIIIAIYNLVNAKKDYKFVLIFMLLFHSIQDLNFSYMIILMILGILIALLDYKSKPKVRKNISKVLAIIFCLSLFMGIVICTILFRANIAYKMNIEEFEYSFDRNVYEIEKNINLYAKRVNLDNTESKYINELIEKEEEYINYLKLSSDKNAIEKINNELKEIEKLANYVLHIDKYNKNTLFNVCNIYIRNMDRFINLNFENDIDNGKKYYKDLIEEILDNIDNYYKLNEDTKNNVNKFRQILNSKN